MMGMKRRIGLLSIEGLEKDDAPQENWELPPAVFAGLSTTKAPLEVVEIVEFVDVVGVDGL